MESWCPWSPDPHHLLCLHFRYCCIVEKCQPNRGDQGGGLILNPVSANTLSNGLPKQKPALAVWSLLGQTAEELGVGWRIHALGPCC